MGVSMKSVWILFWCATILTLVACTEGTSEKSGGNEPNGQNTPINVIPLDPNQPNPNQPNPNQPGNGESGGQTGENSQQENNGAETETDESCNDSTPEFCDGQVAHFCGDNNKMVLRDCAKLGGGLTCHKMTEDNYVDCVAPCQASSFEEFNDCEGNSVAGHFCMDVTDGGTYEFIILHRNCAKYCYDGLCQDELLAVEGAPCDETFFAQCDGNDAYQCESGTIRKTSCGNGTTCAVQFGSKVAECTTSCSGVSGDVYNCINEGGTLKTNNRVCRLGTDARYHLFTESEVCANTCIDGTCDIASVPNHGDSCDFASFKDFCHHNVSYYCDYEANTVVADECIGGTALCRYRADHEFAGCAAPCEAGTEPARECTKINGVKYLNSIECLEGSDGRYYSFSYQETCPNGCNNGKCL